jgi:hypothetical protein
MNFPSTSAKVPLFVRLLMIIKLPIGRFLLSLSKALPVTEIMVWEFDCLKRNNESSKTRMVEKRIDWTCGEIL